MAEPTGLVAIDLPAVALHFEEDYKASCADDYDAGEPDAVQCVVHWDKESPTHWKLLDASDEVVGIMVIREVGTVVEFKSMEKQNG